MRKPSLFVLLLLVQYVAAAGTFYVHPDGSDSNDGSELRPWQTIQHGVDTLIAGDTLVVLPGRYDERVKTAKAGTADARITYRGQGQVIMKGWEVNHPYITVQGFEITGHSAPVNDSAYVLAGHDADHFHLLNCTVRDGIHLVKPDYMFQEVSTNSAMITSPSGGFVAAGFKPGQEIYIGKSDPQVTLLNAGTRTISDVTDSALTVGGAFTNQGPAPAYISGSMVYGLYIRSGAEQCLIRSNLFKNLSFDSWFVGGRSNIFENNVIRDTHGWDAIHFMGTNLVFRYNIIGPSPLVVYQISPDAFENWGPTRYYEILFEHNFVYRFKGVLSSQKGTAGFMDKLTFRNNVFYDVGIFAGRNPNTTFENNTFVYVAATNNPVMSVSAHTMVFAVTDVSNTRIQNNIFMGCGQGRDQGIIGWYEFVLKPSSAVTDHNFVSGLPPTYPAKRTWPELDTALNGGDPGFVNLEDPLGPDGLPFTEDDGLRLKSTSKLIRAGTGGTTIGAYEPESPVLPTLLLQNLSTTELQLSWPRTVDEWNLESATAFQGPWNSIAFNSNAESNWVNILPTNSWSIFRLVR